jgi:hypothetical protein
VATAVAAVVALAGYLAAIVGPALEDLSDARDLARRGRDQTLSADLVLARRSFEQAARLTATGGARLDHPVLEPLGRVPVLGEQLSALQALASAGAEATQAGSELVAGVQVIPGGLDALAPADGGLRLEPLKRLQTPVANARRQVAGAREAVAGLDTSRLVGPLRETREQLTAQLRTADELLGVASQLLGVAPQLLGDDTPRRYFFGAASPAELRGTAGLIGAFSVLTVDQGQLSFGPFAPVQELPDDDPTVVKPLTSAYAERYYGFGDRNFLLNANLTPNFPAAATIYERVYRRATSEALDGMIVARPAALASLLTVTGPIDVRGFGEVNAGNVVATLTNEAYGRFASSAQRKRLLGAVATKVFERFLATGGQSPQKAARALAVAAGREQLLVHATDPQVQKGLQTARVAGELRKPDGDYLAVVGNNAAANKIDFYAYRDVTYEATLRPEGVVNSRLSLGLFNAAPRSGQPAYVIGPLEEERKAGQSYTLLSVFCGDCQPRRVVGPDGEPRDVDVQPDAEQGHTVLDTYVELDSGQGTELTYEWVTEDAWSSGPRGGVYRLTYRDQATIQQSRVKLSIAIPSGMEVTRTSHDMTVEGDRVTWQGTPHGDQLFEIELNRADRGSVWSQLMSVF